MEPIFFEWLTLSSFLLLLLLLFSLASSTFLSPVLCSFVSGKKWVAAELNNRKEQKRKELSCAGGDLLEMAGNIQFRQFDPFSFHWLFLFSLSLSVSLFFYRSLCVCLLFLASNVHHESNHFKPPTKLEEKGLISILKRKKKWIFGACEANRNW